MSSDDSHASPHGSGLLIVALIAILGASAYAIATGNDGLLGIVSVGYLVLLFLVVMSFISGWPFGGQMRGGF